MIFGLLLSSLGSDRKMSNAQICEPREEKEEEEIWTVRGDTSWITEPGSVLGMRLGEDCSPGFRLTPTDPVTTYCAWLWSGTAQSTPSGRTGILNSCVFSFPSAATLRWSAHFEPVTFFNCFIIYGRGGTLVIDPSFPLSLFSHPSFYG